MSAKKIKIKNVDLICYLYKNGHSIQKIVNLTNNSFHVVRRTLLENNVKLSRGLCLDEKLICSLYNDGFSMNKIANKLGVSLKPIRRILAKNNIVIKPSKYILNENFLQIIDTPEKAYILGLLYADGNSATESNAVKISLKEQDKYILDQINKLCESNRPLYCNIGKTNKYFLLQITNKNFYNNVVNLGIIPNKTHIVRLPNLIGDDLFFDFIRGWFDGDGYFYISKNRKKPTWAICGTYLFCNDLKEKLELYKLTPRVYKNKTHNESAEIRLGRIDDINKIYSLLYKNSTIHINRKKEKIETYLNYRENIKSNKALITNSVLEEINNSCCKVNIRKISNKLNISRYKVSKIIKSL